jgi:hypothetical protein
MHLKPQDIAVLVKLLGYGDKRPSYAQISKDLFLSPSEVHASVQRAMCARLLQGPEPGGSLNKAALQEFLIHGVKYAFPPQRGELTRGIPTAHAAEPLKRQISAGNEPPPVWPSAMGKTRGYSFAPLNAGRFAPEACITLAEFVENFYLKYIEEKRASTRKSHTEISNNHIRDRIGHISSA